MLYNTRDSVYLYVDLTLTVLGVVSEELLTDFLCSIAALKVACNDEMKNQKGFQKLKRSELAEGWFC